MYTYKNMQINKKTNELDNFKDFVIEHDEVANSTFNFKMTCCDENNFFNFNLKNDESLGYYYFDNILLELEIDKHYTGVEPGDITFIENTTKYILDHIVIKIGSFVIDELETNVIINHCKNLRKCKSFSIETDKSYKIFIQLPFNITTMNNIFLKSLANTLDISVLIKYDSHYNMLILNQHLSCDTYSIDLRKNKIMNKSLAIFFIFTKNDPMFTKSVRNVSTAHTLKSFKSVLDKNYFKFNFFNADDSKNNRKIDGIYFYFFDKLNGKIVTKKIFDNVQIKNTTNDDNNNNNNSNSKGVRFESFLCNSSYFLDENYVYNYPLNNIGKLKFSENLELVFENLETSNHIEIIVFSLVENYLIYFNDHTAGLLYY